MNGIVAVAVSTASVLLILGCAVSGSGGRFPEEMPASQVDALLRAESAQVTVVKGPTGNRINPRVKSDAEAILQASGLAIAPPGREAGFELVVAVVGRGMQFNLIVLEGGEVRTQDQYVETTFHGSFFFRWNNEASKRIAFYAVTDIPAGPIEGAPAYASLVYVDSHFATRLIRTIVQARGFGVVEILLKEEDVLLRELAVLALRDLRGERRGSDEFRGVLELAARDPSPRVSCQARGVLEEKPESVLGCGGRLRAEAPW